MSPEDSLRGRFWCLPPVAEAFLSKGFIGTILTLISFGKCIFALTDEQAICPTECANLYFKLKSTF